MYGAWHKPCLRFTTFAANAVNSTSVLILLFLRVQMYVRTFNTYCLFRSGGRFATKHRPCKCTVIYNDGKVIITKNLITPVSLLMDLICKTYMYTVQPKGNLSTCKLCTKSSKHLKAAYKVFYTVMYSVMG